MRFDWIEWSTNFEMVRGIQRLDSSINILYHALTLHLFEAKFNESVKLHVEKINLNEQFA